MTPTPLSDDFYLSLFTNATGIYLDERHKLDQLSQTQRSEQLHALLANRTPAGLSPEQTAQLLALVRDVATDDSHQIIKSAAASVRREAFGDDVATMVPIEVSSYCQSGCKFCGWRADNKEMTRLAISEEAIRVQARKLAAQGFSHFEIAGGDDLNFIRTSLPSLVRGLKEETAAVNPEARVSLCLVPMHESQYRSLAEVGLDCVLTWQETYDEDLFNFHIPSGPKAWGIDEDYKLTKGGNGFLARLRSQENAIRAGLQAGLGTMMGLSAVTEADILSVVLHGQGLLHHYADAQPLILGMPAWNSITTTNSDNRDELRAEFDAEATFELVAAIYLLAFPDKMAWVFANGRVAPEVQTAAVRTACCFTSTCVQIAPGAYLDVDAQLGVDERKRLFVRSSVAHEELTNERVLAGEQFVHYYLTHADFVSLFEAQGLDVVNDVDLFPTREETPALTVT